MAPALVVLASILVIHSTTASPVEAGWRRPGIFGQTQQKPTVNVDFDRQANFARCTTYSWVQGQPAKNPFVDRLIVANIEGALNARGWRKVDQDATCLVLYQASLTEKKPAQVWGNGMGPGWSISSGPADVRVNRVLEGMLVVDIGDAESRQIIWRRVASDTVADTDEKNQTKLAEIMTIMFKDFPPGRPDQKIQ